MPFGLVHPAGGVQLFLRFPVELFPLVAFRGAPLLQVLSAGAGRAHRGDEYDGDDDEHAALPTKTRKPLAVRLGDRTPYQLDNLSEASSRGSRVGKRLDWPMFLKKSQPRMPPMPTKRSKIEDAGAKPVRCRAGSTMT